MVIQRMARGDRRIDGSPKRVYATRRGRRGTVGTYHFSSVAKVTDVTAKAELMDLTP
jgi:hypothetical protein